MCENALQGKNRKNSILKTFFDKTLDKFLLRDYNTNVADARVAELADALA